MNKRPFNRPPFNRPRIALLWLILLFICACSGSGAFVAPRAVPDDRLPVADPDYRAINIPKDLIEKQFFDQLKEAFNLPRQVRRLSGHRREAANLNAFDEPVNSSWYTRRHSSRRMSIEELVNGPNSGEKGPDTNGAWTITKVKNEGVTPGFNVVTESGVGYVIKFEPPGFSELASGAEVIGTKFFHAAGFNVPENYIVFFRPEILRIGEGLTFTDKRGRERLFNAEDLAELMKGVEARPDGRIRVAASKLIPAKKFLGPFSYKSTRKDDPNDFIRHEHRRELRGLRVMAAWLNHYDTKDNNTLDVLTHQDFVKHYLIDFGSTMGSQGNEPMPPQIGYENAFDPHQVFINSVTLGLYVRPWEKHGEVIYPAIGFFSAENFHPQKYKFIFPNPAFEMMTTRDGFWGAKLVMAFRDADIEAIVAEGRYTDPAAAAYLVEVLKKRRDIICRYWFWRANPLDRPVLTTGDGGQSRLSTTDLAVESGLAETGQRRYRYRINGGAWNESGQPEAVLPGDLLPNAFEQVEVAFSVKDAIGGEWMEPFSVFLGPDPEGWQLIGVRR